MAFIWCGWFDWHRINIIKRCCAKERNNNLVNALHSPIRLSKAYEMNSQHNFGVERRTWKSISRRESAIKWKLNAKITATSIPSLVLNSERAERTDESFVWNSFETRLVLDCLHSAHTHTQPKQSIWLMTFQTIGNILSYSSLFLSVDSVLHTFFWLGCLFFFLLACFAQAIECSR